MQAWEVAMVVVLLLGLALTVYGALHDRAVNRRRAAEMLGPPQREIPHLPADARAPTYVTEAQARRRPERAGPPPDQPTTRDEQAGHEVEVSTGYASADFVTNDQTREAVLHDPLVLVCPDAVETVRELLPALERALQTGRPLVVVAPTIAPDVLGTLEVNAIQGKVPGLAVLGDEGVRAQVVAASGAQPVDRTDRHSGWLAPDALGHLARWTSTRTSSRLVPATRMSTAE